MKKRYEVSSSSQLNGQLNLILPDTLPMEEAKKLMPTGNMLVDSDNNALIYILENDEDYIYIALQESVWSQIQEASEKDDNIELLIPIKDDQDYQIGLDGLKSELAFLKDNVADNANYGEELVNKFTKVFLTT
jgi:hypothetical protein